MATLAVGVLIGWALLSAFPGTVPEENHLAWALAQVAGIGIADPSSYVGEPPAWVVTTLTSFASIGLIVFVIVLLRSRRTASSLSGTDEKALRALLDVYGEHDSLAYFATRRDTSVIFSADGRAAIAYRVEMSVCLAAGIRSATGRRGTTRSRRGSTRPRPSAGSPPSSAPRRTARRPTGAGA